MEETVCIVKPDAVLAGLTDRVLGAAEEDGFYIVRKAEKRLTPARARAFYAHLEGTNLFRPACEFLSSGPVVCAVLSKVNAVSQWKQRVGPTDPVVAREVDPSSIRAQLGVDTLRNVVHASSSVIDAAREKQFLFPTGPLRGLVPKEYLLETLVMPGLVEALGELYVAQPKDAYAWMSHWFATNDPPSREILNEWPTAVLPPKDALEEAASATTCHKTAILGQPMYEGTWNFRRCKDRDPVYGTGACDADGARAVINGLRKSGHTEICWIWCADEPVVYVGGEPAVVCLGGAEEDSASSGGNRTSSSGNSSSSAGTVRTSYQYSLMKTSTTSPHDLDRMERRLVSDVLVSAADAVSDATGGAGKKGSVRVLGGKDLSSGRRSQYSVRDIDTEQLEFDLAQNGGVPDPRTLASMSDVFKALRVTKSGNDFLRVPTPKHGAPTERSLERVVEQLVGVSEDAAIVFACCDGIERTTVGMIAGCLVWRGRCGELEAFRDEKETKGKELSGNTKKQARPDYDACEFTPVIALCDSLFELGLGEAKQVLDDVIDTCDALFDVRGVVNKNRLAAAAVSKRKEKQHEETNFFAEDVGVPAEKARVGLLSLERYAWLLLFSAYCLDRGASGFAVSFGSWTRARWGLRPKSGDMVLA